MSKEAHNPEDLDLSTETAQKLRELAALLSAEGFGPDGPPLGTTFAEIESFGHSAGRMMARLIDEHLTEQHAAHFEGENACPVCSQEAPTKQKERSFQTGDGAIGLQEPACHCSVCDRAFFPSTHVAGT